MTSTEHTPEQQQTFRDLGVIPELADALEAEGIATPFPIQNLTLPLALNGTDIIGQARTGTGKTFAFGLPLLQRVNDTPGTANRPRALVVVPTRELAIQVAADLTTASKRSGARVLTVYGGRAYEPQIAGLESGIDIVVGTPGRLLDLQQQGYLDLSEIVALVLDEADKMLDLGFLPDIERILTLAPERRQTMLFSATMPSEIVALSRRYLRRPTHVRASHEASEQQLHSTTEHHVFRTHPLDKQEMLARLLQAEERGLTMVFCQTKRACDKVSADLTKRGFAAAAVHGDLGQSQRERALRAFRNGKIDILVATDVAARGLDVDDVTHVINYECPEDEKTYLHRTGRTGRAGRSGIAVTFIDWEDIARWKLINSSLELDFNDPPETYSTSEHFFTALGIPSGTKGTLAEKNRARSGLGAEDVEDIGDTGKHSRKREGKDRPNAKPRSRSRRRTRGGRSQRGSEAGEKAPESGASGKAGKESGDHSGRPRRRRRRRTRNGVDVHEQDQD